jgi:hypothetical protein
MNGLRVLVGSRKPIKIEALPPELSNASVKSKERFVSLSNEEPIVHEEETNERARGPQPRQTRRS